jgi:hypothetical protein
MRIFVQNATTHEYWRVENGWTKQQKDAAEFKTSMQAIELCVRSRLKDAQILLRFAEDPCFDIVLPLSPLRGEGSGEKDRKLRPAA